MRSKLTDVNIKTSCGT